MLILYKLQPTSDLEILKTSKSTTRKLGVQCPATWHSSTRLGIRNQIATHDMPPPALIVEVVSPKQENRDYRHKRSEYAAQPIPEYWIVDTQPPTLESGSCDVLFIPSRKSTSPRRICNCGPDRARRMTNPSTTGVWEMLWSST